MKENGIQAVVMGEQMSIWNFSLPTRSFDSSRKDVPACPFCRESLTPLTYLGEVHRGADGFDSDFRGSICDLCGWWILKVYRHIDGAELTQRYKKKSSFGTPDFIHQWYWTYAVLKEFDLADIRNPINEVQDYLIAKYERRFEVNSRLMEETVGAIFRSLGWDVLVTAYSKDGGIDAILTKDGKLTGVQVKRHRASIEVGQVRDFSGALLAKRITTGVFVTTSRFTKGAQEFTEKVFPEQKIELMNADRLFDALKITRRGKAETLNEIFQSLGLEKLLKRKRVAAALRKHFVEERRAQVASFKGPPPRLQD